MGLLNFTKNAGLQSSAKPLNLSQFQNAPIKSTAKPLDLNIKRNTSEDNLPFDATKAGILRNTILGLPKAAKDIFLPTRGYSEKELKAAKPSFKQQAESIPKIGAEMFSSLTKAGNATFGELLSDIKPLQKFTQTKVGGLLADVGVGVEAGTEKLYQYSQPKNVEEAAAMRVADVGTLFIGNIKLGGTSASLIAKSKNPSKIFNILKKEIPDITDEGADVLTRILTNIDDVDDVQKVITRTNFAINKGRDITPTKGLTVKPEVPVKPKAGEVAPIKPMVTKTQVKGMVNAMGGNVDFKVVEEGGKKYLGFFDGKTDIMLKPTALGIADDSVKVGQVVNINANDLKTTGTRFGVSEVPTKTTNSFDDVSKPNVKETPVDFFNANKGKTLIDFDGEKLVIDSLDGDSILLYSDKTDIASYYSLDEVKKLQNNQEKIKSNLKISEETRNKDILDKRNKQIEYDNLYGYGSNKTPLQIGAIKKNLNRKSSYNLLSGTRKDIIKQLVDDGRIIGAGPDGFVLGKPYSNSGMPINKTEKEFADYLINQVKNQHQTVIVKPTLPTKPEPIVKETPVPVEKGSIQEAKGKSFDEFVKEQKEDVETWATKNEFNSKGEREYDYHTLTLAYRDIFEKGKDSKYWRDYPIFEQIKTKSQLKEIWNKENKSKPTLPTKPADLTIKPEVQKPLKYSKEGIPLALNKREQAIVDRSNKPKVLQVDTTTAEGRLLEKSALQQGEEIVPISNQEKNISLENIISKEATPVNKKVNPLDYFRTPDRVLKKIGLDKEAKLLRTQHDKYLKELPKNIDTITKWSERVSKTGNEDIFKWLDGEAIDLKPQDKKVALEIKDWLKNWADRLNLPKDNRITNYITHIFDKELIAKEFPEELAKILAKKVPGEVYDPFLLKRLGALGYRKDTWKALDAYVKRATRKVYMDEALKDVKAASELLEGSQYDYVKKHVDNINMRPGKIDNLIDNGIKQVIGYKLGQRPLLTVTRTLRNLTYRAMLGLNLSSALKNISQGINTYAKLGEKYTIIGYTKLFQKSSFKELKIEGVLDAGFIEDRALTAGKKALERFDKVLYVFFENAERINRGAAYFGAKSKGIKQGMTEEKAIEFAKKTVRDTQFVFGKIDTPLIMSSDLGKTILQFQSFTTKQVEFLAEMSKKAVSGDKKAQNFIGLLRYALAGIAFVTVVGKAFGMDIKDLVPFFRFGTPPSLKLPYEIGKAALNVPNQYGQERDLGQKVSDIGKAGLGLVPAGIQAKKTIQGIEAINQGKSTTKTGVTQFDVGGTPAKDMQAILFGKYAGEEAQQYYDEDVGYTEATLNKIKASDNPQQAFAQVIQDNPELAKNIVTLLKEQALGLTDDDKKLKNMGVANKARATEIAKQVNKLDTPEEKATLLKDYFDKKIITADVLKQLVELLK